MNSFDIPCDLVISAVGEQVDSALMAANGIEVDKQGPPRLPDQPARRVCRR